MEKLWKTTPNSLKAFLFGYLFLVIGYFKASPQEPFWGLMFVAALVFFLVSLVMD
jgi:hypothetical protein